MISTTNLVLIPAALVVLWTLFLAYSALRAKWNILRIEVKIAGIVVVLCGLLIDIAVNWTLGLLLGVTRDFTLSQKCKRLGQGYDWRVTVAQYLCRNWLNPFDKEHC